MPFPPEDDDEMTFEEVLIEENSDPFDTEEEFEEFIAEEQVSGPKRTKETNPQLGNRLPRERGALIASPGDGLTPFQRALLRLGSRVKDKKTHYTLDGRPCNTDAILEAARSKK